MTSFDFLWQLVEKHGGVSEFYKADCARLWDTLTLAQQRAVYRSIRDKLRAGRFVHYNPVKAVIENIPKQPKQQVLSYADYYARYHTTEERDGWKMANPTGEKVIYVKG